MVCVLTWYTLSHELKVKTVPVDKQCFTESVIYGVEVIASKAAIIYSTKPISGYVKGHPVNVTQNMH